MAKYTKAGKSGGRKSRSGETGKDKTGSASSWQRPDGRKMRARKGDFFPDAEIDKRKKNASRGRGPYNPENSESFERPAASRSKDENDSRPDNRSAERRPYVKRDHDDRKPGGSRFGDREKRSERPSDEKPYRSRGERFENNRTGNPGRDNDSGRSERYVRHDDTDKPRRDFEPRREQSDRPGGKFNEKSSSNDKRKSNRPPSRFGREEQRTEGFKRMDKDQRHAGERQFRKTASSAHARPYKSTGRSSKGGSADGEKRLNKFIANTGLCSRREADELIEAGVISVNGEVVTTLGTKVKPGDDVRYNGEPLRTERHVYVLLNKPKDFITTTDDPGERKTVMNLVEDACKERIYPVGRLDRNTTGLLLLTNDGELTKKLTHPSYNIKKVYQVELDRNLTAADMNAISEGVELEDGLAVVDEIAYILPDDKKQIGVELHSGRNRIVRRIFESLGYQVKKLDRTVFAGLTKKDLPRGRWRFLTEMELNMLQMAKAGKRAGKTAG
ncbi:MAG TPA: pseudouridine synthase [Bacteroidia bacterium]|nr:pseudouridine synthase [Bacteroidia bacterium]